MVEWSVCRTCNPAVPGQVPLWPLAGFVLCGPEFKSSAMLVNSQLVASCLFNPFMLYLNYLFLSIVVYLY